MAPAMKWMAKKTESEEKVTKGKGKKKDTKEKEESGRKGGGGGGNWWNDGWNDYSDWGGWHDWGTKSKPKKGKGDDEKPKGKSKGKHEDREPEEKPEKGKGKGKGKGKSEKGHDRDWGPPVNGAKTVAEVEAEMAKGKIERVKRNADSGGKQPVEAKGTHCQVHKHSGMGCAVVSLEAAQHREAIMNYAEKTYGWSPLGKLEMDIADVKVQLKRHKDKSTGREVLTDIFVAWGHQQEKDSPLTVDEIAEFFDKLYEDAMSSPPSEGAPMGAAQAAQAFQAQMLRGGVRAPPPPMHAHPHPGAPHAPPPPNPYFNAMYNMMHNPHMGAGMNPYMQHSFAAQQQAQAAAYAAYQHQMQQQYMQMYGDGKGAGKWGKGPKGAGKGKSPEEGAAPAAAPAEGEAVKAEASADGDTSAVPDFSPPKPRLLQIVDPASGKPIDTIGMNFAPRKPSTPLPITNPKTGEAVAVEPESKS
ncbi:unnamed protein product [Durusdinium trenchii]|uniref:Uncharacterized protein n=1 Tax=Durusdinium trenchii TaxID=1381693 RepID=A0ABP0JKR6_9DINO